MYCIKHWILFFPNAIKILNLDAFPLIITRHTDIKYNKISRPEDNLVWLFDIIIFCRSCCVGYSPLNKNCNFLCDKIKILKNEQVILRETASYCKHWSQQHVAFSWAFFAWKFFKTHIQNLEEKYYWRKIFPVLNRDSMYGIFRWLAPVNIHTAVGSGEDTAHGLLSLWVSLLPPCLHWEHWALAEWGAAAALTCGSWRAEAMCCTLTCSKLSWKQEHFGLSWTLLGKTIFSPTSGKTCLSCHVPHFSLLLHPNHLHLTEPYKPCLTNFIHYFLLWWALWRKTAHV